MLDRRSFIAATGAAALSPGETQKIRTGILGVQHSHLSGKLQAMLDHPAYEVAAAAEPDEATRRMHQNDALLKPLQWVTPEQMIADPALKLIVFEGEVKDAVPYGRRIIESGKHLHLEKPPANRMEPFRGLVEAARERKLKLQLGYLWRFHAGAEAAMEAYRAGWFGQVYMIRATINADRDMNQRAIEARYAGGTMFELGGHMIDLIVGMLGRPANVRSWIRHDTSIADQHADNTLAVLEYPKTLALVVSSARDPSQHRSLEIIGTDGSMLVQPMEPAPLLRVHVRSDQGPYKKGVQEVKLPPQARFVRDFQELAKAILNGTPLLYSYDHELLLQETLLRASGET
jgi:predicted dehydrogenase